MTNTPSPFPEASVSVPMLRDFRHEDFRARLDAVLCDTRSYDGTLSDAWDVVRRPSLTYRRKTAPDLRLLNASHVRQLVGSIRNAGLKEISMEAGHLYAYHTIQDEPTRASVEEQYAQADAVGTLLEQGGIAVRRLLFVDDYNLRPGASCIEHNLDLDAYAEHAADHGFPPDHLILESTMAPVARTMVDVMRKQGLVTTRQTSDGEGGPARAGTFLQYNNVELMKPDGRMTCSALDAALSVLKYRHLAPGLVNVLPKAQDDQQFNFKGQQRKVRLILGDHLRMRVLPFFNIFTSARTTKPDSSGFHHAFRKASSV